MFITLFIAAFIGQLILSWWIVLPLAMLTSYFFNKRPWTSFFISFIAIYAMWTLFSFYQSWANDHLLGNRMGVLFGLPQSNKNWLWIVLISGLPGGLTAGFGGLAGQYIRKAF